MIAIAKCALTWVLVLELCCGVAAAHLGRTDAHGGHHVTATGEYHYHHGYPAHQHIDGVCPYVYDDRTEESSGNGGGQSNKSEPTIKPAEEKKDQTGGLIALGIFGFLFIGLPLLEVTVEGISWHMEKRRKRDQQTPQALPKPKSAKARPVQPPMRTISKEERAHMIQADAYREMCGGRSIWEMASIPDGVYFDPADLPHTSGVEPENDPFFVYVTPSGKSYHCRTCRLAMKASPINVCQALREYKQPCKLCQPMAELPRFVTRYQELKRIQREYGIDMLP